MHSLIITARLLTFSCSPPLHNPQPSCAPPLHHPIPTHGVLCFFTPPPLPASSFFSNLTSTRRRAQSGLKQEGSHETCLFLCLIAGVPRQYLDTYLAVLAPFNGLSCQPLTCTYPLIRRHPIGISHSPRRDIVLCCYQDIIAPSLPHSQPLLCLSTVGNHFRLGSTSASSTPDPLPRLPSSTAPDRDFAQLLVLAACSCQVAAQTALPHPVSKNPCRRRSGQDCTHMPFALLH